MSRKFIHKCDGCGVEHVETDDEPSVAGILSGLPLPPFARRRQGTDRWGNLTVETDAFPVSFDLCAACTKRVVELFKLKIPTPETMMKRYGRLPGGGVFGVAGGDHTAPPMGALSPEDLEALGLKVPSVTPNNVIGLYKCPGCGTLREGPIPGFACGVCHHQD